ncbi:Hypothetical predicted protein [Olea europaea subsp. europaea]|uniref:Uncharacterized protein n=1 Tax=Olea europaea subsp. europaea TaxID=158383 RepID=A0A8S0SNJ4_OLEEU|nr:Hypothetical predicted protein [Olea europaea subsp. europaea]
MPSWPESHTSCYERGGTRRMLFGSTLIVVVTLDFGRNRVVLGKEMPSQRVYSTGNRDGDDRVRDLSTQLIGMGKMLLLPEEGSNVLEHADRSTPHVRQPES